MRALLVLQRPLRMSLCFMHAGRFSALCAAVEAPLRGGRLPLTGFGRAVPGQVAHKHKSKRICRLLANRRLHGELPLVYGSVADLMLAATPRLTILVDWTPIGLKRRHHAVVASVPVGGRAVVVYAETHPDRKLGSRAVEGAFLCSLADLIPKSARPLIVTDAGYRTPWFDAVRSLGWDFVGRLRHRNLVQNSPALPWFPARNLYEKAALEPLDLSEFTLTRSAPRRSRLIVVRAKRRTKRCAQPRPTPRAPRSDRRSDTVKPNSSKRHRLGASEPWLLVTSLKNPSAAQIANIYRKRMQTEETFRDLKSSRFGWSFDHAWSEHCERIDIIIAIAALSTLALLLLGIAAERLDLTKNYQANTITRRRVLSLFSVGKIMATYGDDRKVPVVLLRGIVDDIPALAMAATGHS